MMIKACLLASVSVVAVATPAFASFADSTNLHRPGDKNDTSVGCYAWIDEVDGGGAVECDTPMPRIAISAQTSDGALRLTGIRSTLEGGDAVWGPGCESTLAVAAIPADKVVFKVSDGDATNGRVDGRAVLFCPET